jgi:hypothetical protein
VKRPLSIACVALVACAIAPAVFGDTSLQSVLFNVNGTLHTDYSVPGLSTAGWNPTTGIGTLTLIFDPGAPGSYFVDAFFDNQLGVPFFNEYGVVNGSPAAGQSWEIGDSDTGGLNPDDTYVHTQNNTLDNTNHLPGTASNFGGACSGADCNGDVAVAMGFSFVLGVNEEEVITLKSSLTDPGGFNLEQIHPVDPANDAESFLFFSGSAITQGTGGHTVPEPGSLVLLGTACALGFGVLRRRLRSNRNQQL